MRRMEAFLVPWYPPALLGVGFWCPLAKHQPKKRVFPKESVGQVKAQILSPLRGRPLGTCEKAPLNELILWGNKRG